MRVHEGTARGGISFGLILALAALPAAAATRAEDGFPRVRPVSRTQAVALLAEESGPRATCLTPRLQALHAAPQDGSHAARRALTLLQRPAWLASERAVEGPHDVRVRYSAAESDFDRIAPVDQDLDGRPDVLQGVLEGLEQARSLLVDGLGLAAPGALEVVLRELGAEVPGYLLPATGRSATMVAVLDASPAGGRESARRAAVHQYAHAVAQTAGPAFPPAWAEALAVWSVLTLDAEPDAATVALLSRRLAHLDAGLDAADVDLAAGNGAWLAFLEEAYGQPAIRLAIDELAKGSAPLEAMDRAIRRVSDDDLAAAFREFHLWSILIGPRADGDHLPFGGRLAGPRFASVAEGLPALSVQADPRVAPWGAAQVRLRPDARRGGLSVHFEGEFPAEWQADLVLVGQGGSLERLAFELTPEGRGQVTVPLHGVAEAWLLVRNLGSDDGSARHYTWAAQFERGYPFELTALEAGPAGENGEGVRISWETASEQHLLGFNVLREREDADGPRGRVIVNPVWIPALGEPGTATWYHYLDPTAEPGVTYLYRIEGVTVEGLVSPSDPVLARRPALLER